MTLDNFRTIELIWDKANKSIIKTVKTASSDTTGRYLSVKVLNNGQEVDLTGAELQLYWEHPNFNTRGMDNFTAVDTKGNFTLTFSGEMLTNIGDLDAYLVLNLPDGKITSDVFTIKVIKGADDGVVVPTNGENLAIKALEEATNKLALIAEGSGVAIIEDGSITTPKIANGAITDVKLDQSLLESLATVMHYQLTIGGLIKSKYFKVVTLTKSAYSRFTPKNNILYKVYMGGGNIEEAAWLIGDVPVDKGAIIDLITVETSDGDIISNVSTMDTLSVSDFTSLTSKENQIYRVFKNSGEETAWFFGDRTINRAYTGHDLGSFNDFMTSQNEKWSV